MISEEDIRKAVESDMKLFADVEKEYPSLGKYKEKVSDQFKKHYQAIIDFVISLHAGKLYRHSLVINGAILRSLNFYRGAIWGLDTRNPHVFYDSLRAQCETLGLIHYCVLKPEYVKAATIGDIKHEDPTLKIKNILTMIDIVDKKYKGIRKDYDALCGLVHPNPASLYANIKPDKKDEDGVLRVTWGTRSPRITKEVAEKNLILLINWTEWIFEELSGLAGVFKKKA
jgi:hypothetical protein